MDIMTIFAMVLLIAFVLLLFVLKRARNVRLFLARKLRGAGLNGLAENAEDSTFVTERKEAEVRQQLLEDNK